ncbi:MAG: hypothetical protein AAF830_04835 [Pseudomonadota bacterium]
MLNFFAAALLAATATSAAVPQDDASWVRAEGLSIPAIYPSVKDQPGPLLTCNSGKYGLIISTRDGDFDSIIDSSSNRTRNMSGSIEVDGEETYKGFFSYRPGTGAASAVERKPAAQVFNAVVRGQSVDFRLGRKVETTLSLPPMDDTFRTFAAECKAQTTA